MFNRYISKEKFIKIVAIFILIGFSFPQFAIGADSIRPVIGTPSLEYGDADARETAREDRESEERIDQQFMDQFLASGSCLVATGIADILTSAVASGLSKVSTVVAKNVPIPGATTFLGQRVPVTDEELLKEQKQLTEKEVAIGGVWPGWDEIAWCMVNQIIKYMSDATITWIKGGFNGKPVFVNDTHKLFRDIVRQELDQTINQLGDGFLCEDFKIAVQISLVEKRRDYMPPKCTFDKAKENIKSLNAKEVFSFNVWRKYTSNPANNPMGAFLTADMLVSDRIDYQEKRTLLELDWGNGFWSWQSKGGDVVTPGSLVQSTAENWLNIPANRLILADEFNEVVTVLVNQLIETSLAEVMN